MNQNQSFNLNPDFLSDFTTLFVKFIFLIILVYLVVLIINFLRDKFINKLTDTGKADITDLLTILNKVFVISGFGFILANIAQTVLNMATHQNISAVMSFRSEWDYLAFGIILIFVGLGLKSAGKTITNNRLMSSWGAPPK